MIKSEISLRVRYAETDQMGVVYYGNYAQYFEIGRVELLRGHGLPYTELEAEGIMMPAVHMSVDYKYPAKYDDEITVVTEIQERPSTKITFLHSVFNQNKQLLCTGKVILVFVNSEFKPVRAPERIIKAFEANL